MVYGNSNRPQNDISTYLGPVVDRLWGMQGSYYGSWKVRTLNPKLQVFYLLKGGYRMRLSLDNFEIRQPLISSD